jgi:hypothetical protein
VPVHSIEAVALAMSAGLIVCALSSPICEGLWRSCPTLHTISAFALANWRSHTNAKAQTTAARQSHEAERRRCPEPAAVCVAIVVSLRRVSLANLTYRWQRSALRRRIEIAALGLRQERQLAARNSKPNAAVLKTSPEHV